MRTRVSAVVFVAIVSGSAVHGLINPRFTPIDLKEQSELILKVEFGPIKDGRCVCGVRKVLQGETDQKTVTLNFGQAMNEKEAGRMVGQIAAAGKMPGVLFVGDEELADEQGRVKGFLHVNGKWIDLRRAEGRPWHPIKIDTFMEGTWAGGTDMLLRAVDYILADETADVPCNEGVTWSGLAKIGNVPGDVTFAGSVDLDGNGTPCLFVASARGDRLFAHADGAFTDVTAKRTLRSGSLVSTWIDHDGDGKLDLVSWDGSAFRLHVQDRNGAIARARTVPAQAPADGCVGLSVLDVGRNGRPGLLISTRGAPILLAPGSLPMKGRRLVEGDLPARNLGKAAACLVADFDGDSFPDIVQPFEKGSFFYRGKAHGRFAPPVPCDVAMGKGRSNACTGDFDADGLLDIFTTAEEGCELWQNAGGGRFLPRKRLSGEIAYISQSGSVAGQACDVNNDGRQDILIVYKSMGAQIFFNRGFRSTGHAHKLDLTDNGLLPPAQKGQQTGCIADFNGDGGQDMVLVLKNGDAHVFWRDTEEASPLALKIDLSPKGPCAGPLLVTGWLGDRCLGAWNVVPGTATGFVGLLDVAEPKVKWRLPGQGPQERAFEVEEAPVRFLIK